MSDVVTESMVALELPGVLEEVATHARSAPGKFSILEAFPETDQAIIDENLKLTMEMKNALGLHEPFIFSGLVPLGGVFKKLEGATSVLDVEEIVSIRDLIDLSSLTKRKLEDLEERYGHLKLYVDRLTSLGQLKTILKKSLDENGSVRPTASPELVRINTEMATIRAKIYKRLDRIINNHELSRIVQEDYVTVRNDRYVILLRPEFKGVMKGIIHDYSRSGASIYVEPFDVVDQNNRVATLADEAREAILQVYRKLTEEIRNSLEYLAGNFEALTELDAFQARAEYAIKMGCQVPDVTQDGFAILGARHPLLAVLEDAEVTPMDVIQDSQTLVTIISGPNMGGKTVALKIAGLFPLMIRCGLLPPLKEGSKIKAFSRIMVDIGDEQDIRGRVSSFSGHLIRIKAILELARKGDLVLLDELGGFTDPDEGAALAMAIIDELKAKQANVVVTTHLTHLKAYALSKSNTKNVSVEFHPITLKPTFRLMYDLPGESHAITTAETIGLPESVIKTARRYAETAAGGSVALIASLKERLEALDREREEIDKLKVTLERELTETREKRTDFIENLRKE
ncbi:MAG: endonuclease MutS2, partial [Desulfomonilaceae bacterium]